VRIDDRKRRLLVHQANGRRPLQQYWLRRPHYHDHIEDAELEDHFEKKSWKTQLRAIRSQVTKTTLDTKCEEYQTLTDQEKTQFRYWKVTERFQTLTDQEETQFRNWKVTEWFRQSNAQRSGHESAA
jgi:hypothetical protein